MKNKKLSISTNEATANAFRALGENGATQHQILQYLLNLVNPRTEIKGTQKVELQLTKWLYLGYDKKITQTNLQRVTSSNVKMVQRVMEQYADEITQFNKSLENE